MFEFRLPDLGEGIHEGEILQWYVRPGERVEEDAPLVEIETDKAAVTIPSPRGGVIVSVTGAVGELVATGQIICVIDAGAEAKSDNVISDNVISDNTTDNTISSHHPTSPRGRDVSSKREAPPRAHHLSPNSTLGGRPIPAAPATRRLARELGVDLHAITGSGRGGRVLPEDVRAAMSSEAMTGGNPETISPEEATRPTRATATVTAETATQTPAIPFLDIEPLPDFSHEGPVEVMPLRSIRRKVARKMTTSMILVPHVAHMDEADVTDLEAFRLRMKTARQGQPGGKLTLLSFVIRAVTAGLRAAPAFNASLDPIKEEIITKRYYNIGFAADTGHGLVVPVIKGTQGKSINEISREIEEKAALAREGKLPRDDMQGGTFTITNVGPLGGTALIPAVNYPEVAILGMGRVQEKPVVRGGEIVIRKILPLTLAFDHRVADGADAARFVGALVTNLGDPNLLLLDT